MNKEEIKEYLKRVEELELKLTGEDKDTLQWLIYGYNECARLLHRLETNRDKISDDLQSLMNDINTKTIIGLNAFLPRLEDIRDRLIGGSNE